MALIAGVLFFFSPLSLISWVDRWKVEMHSVFRLLCVFDWRHDAIVFGWQKSWKIRRVASLLRCGKTTKTKWQIAFKQKCCHNVFMSLSLFICFNLFISVSIFSHLSIFVLAFFYCLSLCLAVFLSLRPTLSLQLSLTFSRLFSLSISISLPLRKERISFENQLLASGISMGFSLMLAYCHCMVWFTFFSCSTIKQSDDEYTTRKNTHTAKSMSKQNATRLEKKCVLFGTSFMLSLLFQFISRAGFFFLYSHLRCSYTHCCKMFWFRYCLAWTSEIVRASLVRWLNEMCFSACCLPYKQRGEKKSRWEK